MTVPTTNLGDRLRALAVGHPDAVAIEAAADSFDAAVDAHRQLYPNLDENDSPTAVAMLAAHAAASELLDTEA